MRLELESLEQRVAPADLLAGLPSDAVTAGAVAQLQAFQQGFIALQTQFDGVIAQAIQAAQPLITPQAYLQIEGEFAALQFLQANWMDLVSDPPLLVAYANATNI